MWVFIKGIPDEMGSKELEKFIKKILKSSWSPFTITGRIRVSGTKILKIVHTRTRMTEYHGLIQIKPVDKIRSVIEKINQTTLDGRRLEAHPYCKRFTRRDPRKLLFNETKGNSPERRQIERRRRNLVSQVIDASF